MSHAKEPWRTSPTQTKGSRYGSIIADEEGGFSTEEEVGYYGGYLIAESITEENRRRIIACVNACAGISTESLERIAAEGMRVVLP